MLWRNVNLDLQMGCPNSFMFNLKVIMCTHCFKPEKMRALWVGVRVGIW